MGQNVDLHEIEKDKPLDFSAGWAAVTVFVGAILFYALRIFFYFRIVPAAIVGFGVTVIVVYFVVSLRRRNQAVQLEAQRAADIEKLRSEASDG
ncbi:MAG: hypothetical protein AAF198_13010 [Pseudomonadota bacterium]